MISGTDIGKELVAAAEETEHLHNMRSGGNIGMAFIAFAIVEHGKSVEKLATALNRLVDNQQLSMIRPLEKT